MIAHLINTDAGNRGIIPVYIEYRSKRPDFLRSAAKLLLENCGRVLVVTGFPVPPSGIPETDGPPGAIALCRAVEMLGGRSEVAAQEEVIRAMKPVAKEYGIRIKFTENPEVKSYDLVIFVETPGKASDGNHYSMSGLPVRGRTFDRLAEDAEREGTPTIGIGDGGNEVGMGNIRDLVVKYIPSGERIASVVRTDELIISAVSNWGAYGLIAEASIEEGRNLLKGWREEETVKKLVEGGLIDGVSKRREISVDGIPIGIHADILRLLIGIVEMRLKD